MPKQMPYPKLKYMTFEREKKYYLINLQPVNLHYYFLSDKIAP